MGKLKLGDLLAIGSRDEASGGNDDLGSTAPTYAELMTLHDEAFVRGAYLLLLGRTVDPIGLDYYSQRLRRGHSRFSVLDQLSKSPEAAEDWDKQPGLREAVDRFRASRRLRAWRVALTDPELGRISPIRRARSLQNSIGSQRQQLENSIQRLAEQQDVVKHMVRELVIDGGFGRTASKATELAVTTLRVRRVESVRAFDLSPVGKAVLETLRS